MLKVDPADAMPCPFCAETDLEMNGPSGLPGWPDCYIQCLTCTTCGPDGETHESALIQWNKRDFIPPQSFDESQEEKK